MYATCSEVKASDSSSILLMACSSLSFNSLEPLAILVAPSSIVFILFCKLFTLLYTSSNLLKIFKSFVSISFCVIIEYIEDNSNFVVS